MYCIHVLLLLVYDKVPEGVILELFYCILWYESICVDVVQTTRTSTVRVKFNQYTEPWNVPEISYASCSLYTIFLPSATLLLLKTRIFVNSKKKRRFVCLRVQVRGTVPHEKCSSCFDTCNLQLQKRKQQEVRTGNTLRESQYATVRPVVNLHAIFTR